MTQIQSREGRAAAGRFQTTHWSCVLEAAESGDLQAKALEDLCRTYWPPVYVYIRRRGHASADAEDLTQEFFARLLARQWLADLTPDGGRFRSFLLTAVQRFLSNQHDYARAAKRGGGIEPINIEDVEPFLSDASVRGCTPELEFDRRWAVDTLVRALAALREEVAVSGPEPQFRVLQKFLSREAEPGDYERAGVELSMTPGAVGVAVLRLRRRYREAVRAIVSQTLGSKEDVQAELAYLLEILRAGGS
ncbi:MAG: RNA polymerase sigma factor [Verrucomicrobiales bacterium]